MKALFIVSAIYLILVGTVFSQPAPALEVQAISPYLVCERYTYASNLHCATNAYRESVGLPALAYNPEAESVAEARAKHLCTTSTFTHEGWEKFLDIDYTSAGENLATGFAKPSEALQGLLNSPTHKDNIEGDWTAMGTFTEPCGDKNLTVQIFTKE